MSAAVELSSGVQLHLLVQLLSDIKMHGKHNVKKKDIYNKLGFEIWNLERPWSICCLGCAVSCMKLVNYDSLKAFNRWLITNTWFVEFIHRFFFQKNMKMFR